jgi:DNA-binding transcriptional MerR regulator
MQVNANVNLHFNRREEISLRRSPSSIAHAPPVRYTITDLSREFGITPRAIRFYEDHGLLAPAREGANGSRRIYAARDRTRLRLTLRGKRLGFTLAEVRRLLDLYDSPTGTVTQLHAFLDTLAAHRAVLERQKEDLDATLAELASHEAQCRALLSANAEKRARKAKETLKAR